MDNPFVVSRFKQYVFVAALAPSCITIAFGENTPAEPYPASDDQTEIEEIESESDGSLDDAEGSIDDVADERGWAFGGDVRLSYAYEDIERRDATTADEDQLRSRWRIDAKWGIAEHLRVAGRVAGICSTDECEPDFILQPEIPTAVGIKDGQITFDELFLHWFRLERFDLAVGRMQTKFVARGGVYAKSLDRNDSNNLRVNWTDGMHGTLRLKGGWASHLILQYNDEDGASNVRAQPLNFVDDDSRATYFLAFENLERNGPLLQRGLDISYLPHSLLKDGGVNGRLEDYWGFVARGAGRWPDRSDGPSLRVSAELGFAPETQTRASEGLAGKGDVDGWAWNFTASIMNFRPTHSIGINYGRTEAGWLLSPQYGKNEQLFEIRYLWRRSRQLAIDVRGRWREDLEQLVTADRKREAFDVYVRFTWGFKTRMF
jgi:hypothetical protein